MSWSVGFIGKSENVAKALQEYSAKVTGQSKIEYDDALPHLVALVKQNFGTEQLIKISAAGSGYAVNNEQKNRSLSCSIEYMYATLV